MTARGRTALAMLTLVALSLLAAPGGAAAKPGYYVLPESHLAIAELPGSNGYRITIAALGPRYAALLANGRGGLVSYFVRAPFHGKRLDVRFGKLGRVSVRFEPTGPLERESEPGGPSCNGPQTTTSQPGRFVGTIRFRGERGFTTARRSAVKTTVFHSSRLVCKRPPESEGGEPEDKATSVRAFVKGNPEGPVFTAYSDSPVAGPRAEGPSFGVSITDRRPSMTVTHSAGAGGEPDAFAVSPLGDVPATATVSPSFPFDGSATLTKSPGAATTWTGDLSVELPGRGTVPLAGPSFSAKLCRNISCACNRRQPCLSITEVGRLQQRLLRLRRR
ncbi:MAG TPA: hypothetical protein VMS60_11170 [Solirubrobacterales bacterium]|nr:hypothetical protein [Solirubrobacterales bacterium]